MAEQEVGGRRFGSTTIIFMQQQFQVQKRKKTSKKGSRFGHLNHGKSVQRFSPWMSYHSVFQFLVPPLIDILEVKGQPQGSNKSIFETHTTNIWIFLVATLIYSIAFAADRTYSHHIHHKAYSQLLSAIALISGSLSVASLVSMIVPFGHWIFIVWAIVVLVIAAYQYYALIKRASCWVQGKLKKAIFKFLELCIGFRGSNNVGENQLPV